MINKPTLTLFLCALIVYITPSIAQKPSLKISSFELMNANDSTLWSLDSLSSPKAVVLVFVSANCALSTNYTDRLNDLADSFLTKGIPFVAINSNDSSVSIDDSFEAMQRDQPYSFPYLKDEDQAVAKHLKVKKNPEAYILVPQDSLFKVIYRGKIDNLPVNTQARMLHKPFLANALQAVLQDSLPMKQQNEPLGCNIKWKKEAEKE